MTIVINSRQRSPAVRSRPKPELMPAVYARAMFVGGEPVMTANSGHLRSSTHTSRYELHDEGKRISPLAMEFRGPRGRGVGDFERLALGPASDRSTEG
jgi:hypothetical protein